VGKKLTVILGNQLFEPKFYKKFPKNVFMAEDRGLCTHFKYHKHKLIHFLSSMRIFSSELKQKGFKVSYSKIENKDKYTKRLSSYLVKNKVSEVHIFEIEDKFFEKELLDCFRKNKVEVKVHDSPMFMCSREEFRDYLEGSKKPFLNSFYIEQRTKHKILMKAGKPIGGKWSFDQENRKKIPKKFEVTDFLPPLVSNSTVDAVKIEVEKYFPSHPGSVDNFWIPVDRKTAKKRFKEFLKNRFEYFGIYEDALDERNPFLYHSLISPAINIGFLTPGEVVKEVEKLAGKDNINAVEGFIRQVMGWREFVRGIYQNFDEVEQKENFFNHKRKLKKCWYTGTTGVEPLDFAIKKAVEYGHCHHIERLMVIGNLMLLLEVHPQQVFKWFMEMFVDSSDWVMGPNIFGMSQFSDGGIFATKPYISGSNYIFKMGHYEKNADWADAWDGLYWRFIDKKRAFLKKNHRMSMMVAMLDKMDKKKKKRIFDAASKLQKKLTI
jgi:deoxyribodipyrimidine photolyase-related protein